MMRAMGLWRSGRCCTQNGTGSSITPAVGMQNICHHGGQAGTEKHKCCQFVLQSLSVQFFPLLVKLLFAISTMLSSKVQ